MDATNSLKKTAIVLFFALNVSIMIIDGLPDRSVVGAKFIKLIARYEALTMLYQPWAMFAPNPMNTNAYVDAEVYFTDGTSEVWPLPRQKILSGMRKIFVGDRYRLLAQESLLPYKNEEVWLDVSKFVSRQVLLNENKGRHRTLSRIIFKRYTNRVSPPPEEPLRPHGTLSSSFEAEPVFVYASTTEKIGHEAKNSR
ncbi:hypothetical protein [Bdellovibrio svalbardensis]|uniref:LPS export ABC transporter periplasmic protein LptC n=1 Tax=Bdellovibrio svalbardensis TaxID=2972972 RepID=A0ABT6DJF1_9BACT|nr:hypothetical protein [Bdellovibrio svalbardensis]MDG0816928.1 hypothetical protein [Bdellovibrio svalbardensis]